MTALVVVVRLGLKSCCSPVTTCSSNCPESSQEPLETPRTNDKDLGNMVSRVEESITCWLATEVEVGSVDLSFDLEH